LQVGSIGGDDAPVAANGDDRQAAVKTKSSRSFRTIICRLWRNRAAARGNAPPPVLSASSVAIGHRFSSAQLPLQQHSVVLRMSLRW